MSTETDKAIVRRYYEGDYDGRDCTANWDQLCDPDMVLNASVFPEPMRGLENIKHFTLAAHDAMSNFQITVEELIAEGDRIAARYTMHGTHTAPLPMPGMDVPPSGKTMAVTGISILRLKHGKIVEETVQADWLGMMQQLGVLPAPAGVS